MLLLLCSCPTPSCRWCPYGKNNSVLESVSLSHGPLMCDGRSPAGSIRGHVQVGVLTGMGGVAKPAEGFAAIMPEPEALAEPFPVTSNLHECSSGEDACKKSMLVVVASPLCAVVPPTRGSAFLETRHTPSKNLEQWVERAMSWMCQLLVGVSAECSSGRLCR